MDANVARAARLECAAISDALDRLRIAGQCHRIAPIDKKFRMTGRAFTILYRPATITAGNVGEYIDDVAPGSVIVIDNQGRDDVSTWGSILTEMAHRNGIAGTLVDGLVRDAALCMELNYPIYSRGHWMRTGKGRIELAGLNVAVNIGGVCVAPGDLIRGDADGVVVVPASREDEVLKIAEDVTAAEAKVRDLVRGGMRMDEARKIVKYHDLQRPKDP
ncbi:diguanylate cyclase [Betaproteobacteria bacterium GR16-43]|nr:diguanylate cyclase [Betaproteobacteria bacterium GR16-43]